MKITDKRISNTVKVGDVECGNTIDLGGDIYIATENEDAQKRQTTFLNLATGGFVQLLWSLEVEKVNTELLIK